LGEKAWEDIQMNKERIMFDSNSFDKMRTSGELGRIAASEKFEYYITSVQIEEIGNMPDKKKEERKDNLLALCSLRAHLVPIPAIVGYARSGLCLPVGDDDVLSDLLTVTRSNTRDAMIGSAAKRERCTVVTDDVRYSKKLKQNGIPTMTYQEFVQKV
jgi:rRNA-processing protein FCF1